MERRGASAEGCSQPFIISEESRERSLPQGVLKSNQTEARLTIHRRHPWRGHERQARGFGEATFASQPKEENIDRKSAPPRGLEPRSLG